MFSLRFQRIVKVQIKRLQRYTGRSWYAPLIGLLSALDNILIVIPNDGILISSSMLVPRRWLLFAISMALGSTMGAFFLAYLVELHGLPWILSFYPSLTATQAWIWSLEFFSKFGLYFVFLVSLSPLMQQPVIVLAGMANTPLLHLMSVVFFGRLIKFLLMSYLASHSPKYLSKLWGIKKELRDVDIKIE